MNAIVMRKTELLEILRKNRDNHRDLFLKAQEGYRKQVIAEFERMLEEARDHKPIRREILLPEPIDHTNDYDTIIQMLELDISDEAEIGHVDFQRYVRDEWPWSGLVTTTNMSYLR